ncbi:prolipoprotein diacylglyceryl transferase [Haloferula sp.]|uniref:prolipoprotein diacylglyceryl transferase n=1 Tax=Haloferula sp. TaxID=2497595 RepID=UPI00329E0928
MFATYVHDLSPVILKFTDAIQLRWYGLAYLAGFLAGAFLLERLSRRKLWVLPPGSAGDFISAAAIFGVFIGGRLGYMFWYWPREHGWGWLTEDPGAAFRVWEGGMASHGGVLGLFVFTWFYSRKKKVSWTGLGDGLCVVAPLGLLFGRMANFINGELYGRTAEGVAWAMKFPMALVEKPKQEGQYLAAALEDAESVGGYFPAKVAKLAETNAELAAAVESRPNDFFGMRFEWMSEAQRSNPEVSRAIEPYLEPRHPSQLYEALLEGAVLFAILWWVRVKYPQAPNGLLTGLFFVFYAVFRIICEQFREPDSKMVGEMTSGQFLSLFMIAGGAIFIVGAMKKKWA